MPSRASAVGSIVRRTPALSCERPIRSALVSFNALFDSAPRPLVSVVDPSHTFTCAWP
jgi:hypothetical protein